MTLLYDPRRGARLRSARNLSDIDLENVARKLGRPINADAVAGWEAGRPLTLEVLYRLSEMYDSAYAALVIGTTANQDADVRVIFPTRLDFQRHLDFVNQDLWRLGIEPSELMSLPIIEPLMAALKSQSTQDRYDRWLNAFILEVHKVTGPRRAASRRTPHNA